MNPDSSTVSSAYAARADLPERGALPARIGRYVPIRRLGRGGMGVVYEAIDPSLGRRLAVKVLHPAGHAGAEGVRARRRRLLREAQAMARLSHPNVLPVFDVGETDDDLFLAMELVAGGSLADWLARGRRSWREVVLVFAAAGRGLAAAHAAGVIHRDFKPANVLVGDDGQVRVVDFGLARSAEADSGPAGGASGESGDSVHSGGSGDRGKRAGGSIAVESPERGAPGSHRSPPADPLTTVGAVLGTPAYMSPEQRRGGPADARSDQYSFCISLWQALGGELSPPASDLAPVAASLRAPRRLRRALLRGLRAEPGERHASMEDLLDELDRLLRRRRRWLAGAAGLTAAVLAGGAPLLAGVGDSPAVCRGAERRLAGVWDDSARRALRSEFAASGHAAAAASAARVVSQLDGYARAWTAMRTEACEATHVHGEQSDELLDLRMQCLDRRLSQLGALVAVLSERPGPEAVSGAVDAAWRLEPLAGCADRDALTQRVPPPPEPPRRARIAQVRASLDRAAALLKAGRYAAGRDLAGFAVDAAEHVDYPPLMAEALLLHGQLLDSAGQAPQAEQELRAAANAAAEAGDDERLATAWATLVFVVGMSQARHQEALQLADVAGAAAIRARSGIIRGLLANNTGAVQNAIGRYPEAEVSFRRALALREAALGRDHPDVASSLASIGSALASQNRLDEAEKLQLRALGLRRAAFGEDHPMVARSLNNLARLASLRGHEADAAVLERRALDIREKTLGANHVDVGISLSNLGGYAAAQSDPATAVGFYERALAVFTGALPPDHPYTARVLSGLGEAYVNVGRAPEALGPLERAHAIMEKLEDPVELANSEYALATAVFAAGGDRPRAIRLMTSARDHYAGAGPRGAEWYGMAVKWLAAHGAAR